MNLANRGLAEDNRVIGYHREVGTSQYDHSLSHPIARDSELGLIWGFTV